MFLDMFNWAGNCWREEIFEKNLDRFFSKEPRRPSSAFFVNFKQILHIVLVIRLLTFNK